MLTLIKNAILQKTESEEDDSGSLQMKNTSGIFLVLGFGGVLGFLVAVVDFLLHVRQICVKEKVCNISKCVIEYDRNWKVSHFLYKLIFLLI